MSFWSALLESVIFSPEVIVMSCKWNLCMTAGPVFFLLPLVSLRTTKKITLFWYHQGRPGTYCSKQNDICFDYCCSHTKKKKKKWFRNIVSMLVYKTYNRFNLVCCCEKDCQKQIFNRKKENLQKKRKKISTNVLIVSAVPPQVYNINWIKSQLWRVNKLLQNRVILTRCIRSSQTYLFHHKSFRKYKLKYNFGICGKIKTWSF